MKKVFLVFIVLFLLQQTSYSQNSQMFPDSGAVWLVDYGGTECYFGYCYTIRYLFSGDTLVNTQSYHKIYEWIGFCPDINCNDSYYVGYAGAMRYDTEQKEMYYLPVDESQDTLAYDYKLEVGDTIPRTYTHDGEYDLTITSIDSVLLDQTYHKRFWFQFPYWGWTDTTCLIEGIGSMMGLMEPLMISFEYGYYLVCHKTDQYIYEYNPRCDIVMQEQEQRISKAEIYPNPADDYVYISLPDHAQMQELKCYDLLGKQKKVPFQIMKDGIYISCNTLSDGYYIFSITTEQNKTYRLKTAIFR